MLYVQQSLGPDEELVHVGQFHWMYTVAAFMTIFWGLVGSIVIIYLGIRGYMFFYPGMMRGASVLEAVTRIHVSIRIGAFLFFIISLLKFANMMIIKATTEIAITDRRLIFKTGLIARRVGEINIDRIEGVSVLQTVMGRIFNYGRIVVRGMGVGELVLPPMGDPITFRKAIEKAKSL